MNYKLTDSLFIGKDRDIISYTTKVARIKGQELEVFSTFTRTTGKHINRVAGLLGLKVKKINKEVFYHKYELGVKVDAPFKSYLSPQTSGYFLEKFRDMKGGSFAPPTREDWFNAMIGMPKIGAIDWAWICLELDIPTKTPQLHSIKNVEEFFKPAFLSSAEKS